MSNETRPYPPLPAAKVEGPAPKGLTPMTGLGLPSAAPELLGFDPARLDRARAVLQRAINEGAFPGAVAVIARHGRVAAAWALGQAQTVSVNRAMTLDTLFDLASLTKVIGATTAALTLLEEGALSLDDVLARFIPEFAYHSKNEVTLRQLLAHTSGLPAWLPLYARAESGAETLRQLCDAELCYEPGTQVLYSDLGPILIGLLCERLSGETLQQLLRRRLFEPLGMNDTGYLPDPALRARCAATELGSRFEQAMAEAQQKRQSLTTPLAPRAGFRQNLILGEVHDGNAHHALRGVSGHAGLFGTAADLVRFAQAMLRGGLGDPALGARPTTSASSGGRVLGRATVAEALSCQTEGLPLARGLGWQLLRKGALSRAEWGPAPAAVRLFPASGVSFPSLRPYGDLLSARTAGHTGFTGCSLAIDPANDLIIALCTNRVHPDASRFAIGVVRPRFHNVIAASLVDPGEPPQHGAQGG